MFEKKIDEEPEIVSSEIIRLEDVIDLKILSKILDGFYKVVPTPTAVENPEGIVLLKSHWKPLCTHFHRVNPFTAENCLGSDTHIHVALMENRKEYVLYKCGNGLYAAAAIIVNNQYLGSFSIRQFLLEKPDEVLFRKQAIKYGFDEELYLAALSKIPIISEKHLKKRLNYLCVMAEMLGKVGLEGLQRNVAQEALKRTLFDLEKLRKKLEEEKEYLQEEINLTSNFGEILGKSKKLKKELKKVEQVANTDSTVLILGETGTGKELFARAIHQLSNRKQRSLVKVNCAALPTSLIESELFGHEKGTFTGATSLKIGKFELADGGTIFLDEIGDLPLDLQTKLLRVLQENEIDRLGGKKAIKIDVRVIAATNRDLDQLRREGKFRDDLFFRLNIFPIDCPTLRDRKDDISMLAKHFLEKFNKKIGKSICQISTNSMKILQEHDWPGNIRELENVIERAVILGQGKWLHLGAWFIKTVESSKTNQLQTLDISQKNYIIYVLKQTDGKIEGKGGAAAILGLKPSTLRSRMKKLEINIRKNIHEI